MVLFFFQVCLAVVGSYGWDGIGLDWIYMTGQLFNEELWFLHMPTTTTWKLSYQLRMMDSWSYISRCLIKHLIWHEKKQSSIRVHFAQASLSPLSQQTVWVVFKPLVVEQDNLELFQVVLCLTNVSQIQHSILRSHPCHLLHICSWSTIGWNWMVFSVFMFLKSVPLPFLSTQVWVAWLDFSLCLSPQG